MSHHNYFLDFTVGVFVVHDNRVLLCHHRNMAMWLPVGGHIDPGETPDQAARRESREEAGIDVDLVGRRAPLEDSAHVQHLVQPEFVDRHYVRGEHWHCGFMYLARPRDPNPQIVLDPTEHIDLRWFAAADLDGLAPITPTILFYARHALKVMGG